MIIVLGIAGGGKSYQCERLARTAKYRWISVGELLRHAQLPADVSEAMREGHIIRESFVHPMVETTLAAGDEPEILLDGFPRTVKEAIWLTDFIKQRRIKLRGILHIGVSREVAIERLLARGRADDNAAAINERFDEYIDMIGAILQHFRDQDYDVTEIHGEGSRQAVSKDIDEVLKELQ